MGMETTSKEKITPNLVVLEKALKLAESWVNNMNGSMGNESPEVEFEGRNPRLGLGAKALLHPCIGPSADPIERRLRAKLNAEKRRSAKALEESDLPEKNGQQAEDEDDSDDEPQSRTNAFTKKRMTTLTPSLQANKKHK